MDLFTSKLTYANETIKMTTIESTTNFVEGTLTRLGYVTGIDKLWVPQFGWADDNIDAGENPFAPQYLAALQVFAWMFGAANKCWIHLTAEMQAGKTGVINALIRLMLISENFSKIKTRPDDMFIITGMNDNAWKKQTKIRMPKELHTNIHHLKGLPSVVTAFKSRYEKSGFKNILVVLDESHIASAVSNTPSKMVFEKMRELCPVEEWAENNIRLVTISATDPAAVIGIKEVSNIAEVVTLRTSDNYQSVQKLRDENRIHNTFNLATEADVSKLVNIVSERFPDTPNLYHMIRLPMRTKKGLDIRESLQKLVPGCNVIQWDAQSNAKAAEEASPSGSEFIDDINATLENEPLVPTFILIKNMFYAAKTLDDTYCGILFDRSSSKDDTNCQSFLGRACGYGHSKRTHIYTNLQTVNRYIEIWSKLKPTDDMIIPVSDPRTLQRRMPGVSVSSQAENVRLGISARRAIPLVGTSENTADSGSTVSKTSANEDDFESEWSEWFTSEEACMEWWRSKGGRPQPLSKNDDGFVICSAQKSGVLDVVDIEKLRSGKKTANSSKTPGKMKVGEKAIRRYGAYVNIADNTTARFCVHVITRIK